METTVTSKGEIVIPPQLRKKYGIKAGTKVQFSESHGTISITPMTPELLKANIGFLGTKGKLLRALMEEKKREREL